MSQDNTNSVGNYGSDDFESVDEFFDFGKTSVRDSVTFLVQATNNEMPVERRVSIDAALQVAERSLTASSQLPAESRRALVIKDVSRFLSVAASLNSKHDPSDFSDLLPAGHPFSTAEVEDFNTRRELISNWVASDLRLADGVRPLVAAAHAAPFDYSTR